MAHAEIHFNIGAGSYQSCICDCKECFQHAMNKLQTDRCLCPGCSCHGGDGVKPLDSAYFADKPVPVEHMCKTCGVEVQRKSNRGRWPSLCPACRENV